MLGKSCARSLFEQRVRDAPMSAGKGDFALTPAYFGFQRGDAFFKFIDRQRVNVLPDQIGQRIVAAQRKVFIGFHPAYFDMTALAVNIKLA